MCGFIRACVLLATVAVAVLILAGCQSQPAAGAGPRIVSQQQTANGVSGCVEMNVKAK